MQELVDFLIEERYCNSELEAVKILESVSDSFYEYIVNESSDFTSLNSRKNALQRELKNPRISSERSSAIYKELAEIGKEMKTQDKIGAAINKITGRKPQQTPRGPGGQRTQTSDIATTRTAEKKAKQTGKPMTGASINDPRVRRAVEKAANRATGSEGEVPIHGTAQKTQQLRHGKHTDNSGNPNKGLTRTGSTRPSD